MNRTELYLDNSATTQPLPEVVESMLHVLTEGFGNPSSGHARGRKSRQAIDRAREQVANFTMSNSNRIIFVSGATEANDAVLRSVVNDPDSRLVTTVAEHPSTCGVYASIPERITRIPLETSGILNMDAYDKAIRSNGPSLVAIGWVNGETGVIQPIREICELARFWGHTTLVDASQAAGRLPNEDFGFEYDFMSISAHKMNGPSGVGCLLIGQHARCPTMAMGGGQEQGYRAGTENIPGIVGFGTACRERGLRLTEDLIRLSAMRDLLEQTLLDRIPGIRINGMGAPRVPTNTNICFTGIDGMALVARCDVARLCCSQISACSTGRPEPSKTLLAMGIEEKDAYSSIRFSVSVLNTMEDIRNATQVLIEEVGRLRGIFGRDA